MWLVHVPVILCLMTATCLYLWLKKQDERTAEEYDIFYWLVIAAGVVFGLIDIATSISLFVGR